MGGRAYDALANVFILLVQERPGTKDQKETKQSQKRHSTPIHFLSGLSQDGPGNAGQHEDGAEICEQHSEKFPKSDLTPHLLEVLLVLVGNCEYRNAFSDSTPDKDGRNCQRRAGKR